MSDPDPMVFVVDDDASIRRSLANLLRSAGWQVETYVSAQEYLASSPFHGPSCLVLDIRLPGLSGLDAQHELEHAGRGVPIIFITGHGDIPMAVQAMKAGAVEFLTKPFREEELLDAIDRAVDLDRRARADRARRVHLQRRAETLTGREREVFERVTSGLANKQVAAELGITEATVKVHRARVMVKMGATSVADLVTIHAMLTRVSDSPWSSTTSARSSQDSV